MTKVRPSTAVLYTSVGRVVLIHARVRDEQDVPDTEEDEIEISVLSPFLFNRFQVKLFGHITPRTNCRPEVPFIGKIK